MLNPIHQENDFEFFFSTEDSLHPLVYALRKEGFVAVYLGSPSHTLPVILTYGNLSPEKAELALKCIIRNQERFMAEWKAIHRTLER